MPYPQEVKKGWQTPAADCNGRRVCHRRSNLQRPGTGAPYVGMIAIGRAAMAAATVGRQVGKALKKDEFPKGYTCFGSTMDEVFADLRMLKAEYGEEAYCIFTPAPLAFIHI